MSPRPPTVDELLAFVKHVFARIEPQTRTAGLTAESRLSELDVESMTIVEAIGEVEDHYDVSLPDDDLGRIDSVVELHQLMAVAQAQESRERRVDHR